MPAASTTVDLDLTGFGSFVAGVPVGSDEPLAPASDQGIPVLGAGRPTFPTSDAVAQAVAQDKPPAV